ncbi:hypothetical protein [Kangiella sp.]|uniref:hypothetical protein n=1 Tax=Kangiella sp. TaxID=1920245 RepID=UPI00198F9293|nr:hypothetical protein [Kangiella sp.]MBD3654076.1 hypothetical protein [Kangiella sp.]
MSLDIHKLQNGQPAELLISISSTEYEELYPAIERFKSKTGLLIDQYSDLKLSSGVLPLIQSIEEVSTESVFYNSLLKVLKQSEADGYGIMFVGD